MSVLEATVLRYGGDLASAAPLAERATEIGERFGDRDLLAMAIHTQGLILIAEGCVTEGVPLLDEAMTSVVAGEVSDYWAGAVYCNVIAACLEIADVRRAASGPRQRGRGPSRSRPSPCIRGSAGSTGPRSRASVGTGRWRRPNRCSPPSSS